MRQLAHLGPLDVINQRPGGGNLRAAERPEQFKRVDAKKGFEPLAGVFAVKQAGRLNRQAVAQGVKGFKQTGFLNHPV